MAKAAGHFRQGDVTRWGLVAVVCGAVAVLSANVAALVPNDLLTRLHATRLDGANVSQLRSQLSGLVRETAQLRRENAVLAQRIALTETGNGNVARRVGALEISIPTLLESLPPDAAIDRSAITAGIGGGDVPTFDVDGGSVRVESKPLILAAPNQPMPEVLEDSSPTDPNQFAIALGPTVSEGSAEAQWQDLLAKLGPLLLGLEPRLSPAAEDGGRHLVAGPITALAEAAALCRRLERVSIACLPVPFEGMPLPATP